MAHVGATCTNSFEDFDSIVVEVDWAAQSAGPPLYDEWQVAPAQGGIVVAGADTSAYLLLSAGKCGTYYSMKYQDFSQRPAPPARPPRAYPREPKGAGKFPVGMRRQKRRNGHIASVQLVL